MTRSRSRNREVSSMRHRQKIRAKSDPTWRHPPKEPQRHGVRRSVAYAKRLEKALHKIYNLPEGHPHMDHILNQLVPEDE